MKRSTHRLAVWAATAVATLAILAPAHAALQNRDINHDGVVDAFFDTDLNITWLRNAGLSPDSTLAQAQSWVTNLNVYGVTGWRLPTSDTKCQAYNCTLSEMGHLYYTELGSTAPHHMNAGSFQNLAFGAYWSGTADLQRSGQEWAFLTSDGSQFSASVGNATYSAMAVHNGDILAAVPEPETYAMLLAGLGLVAASARRRKPAKG